MLNKKAQVGETMTWIIATVIVIVILIVFIFVSSSLASLKGIEKFTKSIFGGDDVLVLKMDWIKVKNSIAFGINSDNEEFIKNWIEKEG